MAAKIFSQIFIRLMQITCGINYHVSGLEKLPRDKAYLVLPNHQSFWENVFLQLIIPEHSWVVKKELYDIPVFGWGLRTVMPIAVDRSNARSVSQILAEGQKKFKSGISLILFPEATRVKPGVNVSFKSSAARLAIASEVPIVLVVHNAGLYWPKGFWFIKPGTIQVKIVEVITVEKVKTFNDHRDLTDYIQEKINHEKNLLV
jgi:1-acyl-sn-glycerol-3-phosphate acyltransferase